MINLMVDLETLGTRPGAAILSIAAVPFFSKTDAGYFYSKIKPEAGKGFHVDDKTIAWWEQQSHAAYEEAFSGTESIEKVLEDFSAYCKSFCEPVVIWGNGSDFDNALLAESYKLLGMEQPWNFRNNRCYRTLKELFPVIHYIKPTISHHALHDAQAQANHAERILKFIKGHSHE